MGKICGKCKNEFPTTNEYFSKNKCKDDGFSGYCKSCKSISDKNSRLKHLEKIKENKKEYYYKNIDEIKIKNKIYREAHKKYNKEYFKEYRNKNKDSLREYHKIYSINNRDKFNMYNKKYREKDIDKTRERERIHNRKYYKEHKKQENEKTKRYYKNHSKEIIAQRVKHRKNKRHTDYRFYINDKISSAINRTLKTGKQGCHWENLVDFTIDELINHLEKLFLPGMSWNSKNWHIDHLRPIASFNFTFYTDPEFKECWSLKNLQPLFSEDNLRKSSHWNPKQQLKNGAIQTALIL